MNRKKWVALIVILAVVVAGFSIEAAFGGISAIGEEAIAWDETVVSGYGDSKIVQLFITGVISGETGTTGTPAMTEQISEQLRRVEEDGRVKAVVLRIDSPGGEVVATDEIHQRILRLKKQKKIPIIVSMGSTAASGGYYIATAADAIFANRNTITGSLGVIFTLTNYAETATRLGIKQYVIKSGRFKDIGSPTRPLTPDERTIFQSLVNESYQNFVDVIVNGRKLPRERVLQIADGRIYSGAQAKKLGLIDQFGDLEKATSYALSQSGVAEAQVVRYTQRFSIGNFLFGLQKSLSHDDPLGLDRLIRRHNEPKLLYQYVP